MVDVIVKNNTNTTSVTTFVNDADIDSELKPILLHLENKLPKFPDGRINYHTSDTAVVLTCFVRFQGKILLLKRSDNVGSYQKHWHAVAGYVDDTRCTLREKVLEELREELHILPSAINTMYFLPARKVIDNEIHHTWIVCTVLVDVIATPKVVLDWEHTEYVWIDPKEITHYKTVPGLATSAKLLFG